MTLFVVVEALLSGRTLRVVPVLSRHPTPPWTPYWKEVSCYEVRPERRQHLHHVCALLRHETPYPRGSHSAHSISSWCSDLFIAVVVLR